MGRRRLGTIAGVGVIGAADATDEHDDPDDHEPEDQADDRGHEGLADPYDDRTGGFEEVLDAVQQVLS